MRLPRIISVLLLLILAAGFIAPQKPVKAAPIATNVISNGSFEDGADSAGIPKNWSFESCEGVANATARVDSSVQEDGANSAQISTGPLTSTGCVPGSQCSPTSCPGRMVGFSQFRQSLPNLGYNITQLSDDPAGFSFWFRLQALNGTSIAGFEVRVFGAESLSEFDYVFDPDPSIGVFQNSTSNHVLMFNGYQSGQWYHFSRDLRADWLTPMGSANTPLNLNYNFTLLQFQGFATKSGSTVKSETFWLDDVRAYTGSIPAAPLLQVWSPDTHSNNIMSTNSMFQPGSQFTVVVNVTGAGPISGFDVTIGYSIAPGITPPIVTGRGQVSLSPGLFDDTGCSVLVAANDAFGAPVFTVHVAAVFLGPCSNAGAVAGTGILFSVQFNVTGTGTTSIDISQTGPGLGQKQLLVAGGPPNFDVVPNLQVSDMIFQNAAGALPVAQFTYSPALPFYGGTVVLNATQSYYPGSLGLPDHGIKRLIWSFDDYSTGVEGTLADVGITRHIFLLNPFTFAYGYFAVRLTVFGSNSQLLMRQEQIVYVNPARVDDVSVSLGLSQTVVSQGQPVTAVATLRNNGNRNENANLNITVDSQQPLVGAENGVSVSLTDQPPVFAFPINTTGLAPRVYTVTAIVVLVNSTGIVNDPTPDDNTASASFTVLPPDVAPVANFTVRPSSPIAGHQVQFDGSASHDPDGFIVSFLWSFGDGSSGFFGTFAYHIYSSPGTYTATLTVQDNAGLQSTASMVLVVSRPPMHDVGIANVYAYPQRAVSSQVVSITVVLVNDGENTEMVNVTAYYGGHVAGTLTGVQLYPSNYYFFYTIQWDTLGVSPGNYTISATVFLANDERPGDNTLSDGLVTILPPPTLSMTPSTGSQGTQVTVHGDGFPLNYGYGTQVLMTFDDQFVGFGTSINGQFTFVFNVPLAQAGVHTVKALDGTGARAFGSFTITQDVPLSRISVLVSGGTLYFPGDKATVYVQTSINGQPISVSSLQIVLVRPAGPNLTLTAVLVAPGEWKATYTVPAAGGIGTYALVVTAHQSASLDGFSLSGFEVKPTWLQKNGTAVAGVTAAFSALAGLAVAWRKGYFSRRKEEFPFLSF